MSNFTKHGKSDLLMASAACAWGFSYIFMKWGLESVTPFQLIFLRFGIAFLFLIMVFRKKIIPSPIELKYSFFLAILVFALSAFYTYGLKTTEASTAGFLAGTTVAMIPIINSIILRKLPEKKTVFSALLALFGVAMMSLSSDFIISGGAWLCILGAFFYALQVILTNHALNKCRGLTIGVWQLGFTALFAGITSVCFGETFIFLEPMAWYGILGLAFVSSAYGYIAQTIAQKNTSPERIGFIYALEPVFCAVLAFFFFHEIMSLKEFIGAIMIIISIIV